MFLTVVGRRLFAEATFGHVFHSVVVCEVFYTVDGCFFRIRVEIKLWLDGSSAAAVACGSWCIGLLVSGSLGLRWRFYGACSGYSTVVYLGFEDESGHCQRVKGISSLNRLGVVATIVFQYAFLHW
ncbi:hypothetical protein F2Q70_00003668 [Brassica cretica]|uniref:Uncharacterized protein n=1 Tax=Brassica cretica TaxID=69181 RepID=A0A8S9IVQ8_BRACR|nr:hypothetical protein F2Q70_00003668 [Brassica cretica]